MKTNRKNFIPSFSTVICSFFISLFGVMISASSSIAEDINGTWHFDYGYDMTFTGSGSSFTGTGGAGSSYTWVITNGVISGNQVSWKESYNEITYLVDRIGTISGDTMSGTWTTSWGQNGSFVANRISGGGGTGGSGNKRKTALQLFCNRGGVLLERATCSVTVADAGPPPRSLPTGAVNFVAKNGFFPGAASCLLQQTQYSPGIGSCEVQFTVPNGFGIGIPFPIDATYDGNTNFNPSSTSHQMINASCIGDQNNPCSGDVAMSFSKQVSVAKNKINQIVLACKKAATTKMYQRIEIPQGTCLTDTEINLDISKVLEKLTAEEIKLLGKAIKASEAKDDEALAKIKALSELNLQRIEQIKAIEGQLRKVMDGEIKNIRAAKKPKRIIAFGKQSKNIRSGKQASLSVSASKRMKKFLTVFRRANVAESLTFEIKTSTKRQIKKGKTSKARSITRQVEAFLK